MNLDFTTGNAYAILGPNGSGKSTLLQVLSGFITPSIGNILFFDDTHSQIAAEDFYHSISMATPYLELMEALTLREQIQFHGKMKPFLKGIGVNDVIEISSLKNADSKPLKNFSSGMKQRVRLVLAMLSDVPVVLLDEPCSNLDSPGREWYRELISRYSTGKLLFVCSNHQNDEFDFCSNRINILDYK